MAAAAPVLFGTAATGGAAATTGLLGTAGAFSLGTAASTIGTLASGVSAFRSLTGADRPKTPSLTSGIPNVADTPQTKLSQVQAARQDSADRARAQAAATAKQNETNLTSGLTLREDSETANTTRAKRTSLGV